MHPQIFGPLERRLHNRKRSCSKTMPGFYARRQSLPTSWQVSGSSRASTHPGHGNWDYGRMSKPPRSRSRGAENQPADPRDRSSLHTNMLGTTIQFQDSAHFDGPRGRSLVDFQSAWPANSGSPWAGDRFSASRGRRGMAEAASQLREPSGRVGLRSFCSGAVDQGVKWLFFAGPATMISGPVCRAAYVDEGGARPGACGSGGTSKSRSGAFDGARSAADGFPPAAIGRRTRPHDEFPDIQPVYQARRQAGKSSSRTAGSDAPHKNYNKQKAASSCMVYSRECGRETDSLDSRRERISASRKANEAAGAPQPQNGPDNAVNYADLWAVDRPPRNGQTICPSRFSSGERLTLRLAACWNWTSQVLKTKKEAIGFLVARAKWPKGDRVPAIWGPGNGPAALMVHPEEG